MPPSPSSPSVAVILGSSRGIGLHLARRYLSSTDMQVVALSRDGKAARSTILESGSSSDSAEGRRLTTLSTDCTDERSIESAAQECRKRFGGDSLRLLLNVAGVLKPEKSLSQVEYEDMLHMFKLNTFAPLLSFKHFVPLLPKRIEGEDASRGLLPKDMGVIASLSARVGSIGDNGRGGWYSYRASKAAQNQLTRTLSHELRLRNLPALAVALHPGTVATELSREFTGGPGGTKDRERKHGEFEADEAAENLVNVISKLGPEDSGVFRDWDGKEVVW